MFVRFSYLCKDIKISQRKTEVSWRRKSADFLSEDITRSRPRFLFAVRESRGLCLFCREHSVHTIASVLDLSSVDLWIGVSRVRRRPPFSCLFARRVSGILSSRRTRGVKSLVALATRDLVVCYCDAVLSFFFFILLGIDGKRSPRQVVMLF